MAKRGYLSEQEKDFIKRNRDSLTVDDIAKSLDRTTSQIETCLKELDEGKVEPQKKDRTPVEKLMARKEKNGQVQVTVMTPGASELSDLLRGGKKSLPAKMGDSVHRPKG